MAYGYEWVRDTGGSVDRTPRGVTPQSVAAEGAVRQGGVACNAASLQCDTMSRRAASTTGALLRLLTRRTRNFRVSAMLSIIVIIIARGNHICVRNNVIG